MDDRQFDSLARSLAVPKTRRALLGSLAALGAGLLGVKNASAQVTQRDCGNRVCASDPGVCSPGCVCCVYPNGNSRCRPPQDCIAPGTVVSPATTTTQAPTTTTTIPPTTTAAPTTTTTTTTTVPPTSTTTTTTAGPTTTTTTSTTTSTAAPTTTTTTTTTTSTTTSTAAPTTTTTTTTTAAPVGSVTGTVASTDPTSQCTNNCPYNAVAIEHGGGPLSLSLRGGASGGGTLSDPYLLLFSGSGYLGSCIGMETFNDDGPCGSDSYIAIADLEAGTYTAIVWGYQCVLGTYTLEWNTPPPCA